MGSWPVSRGAPSSARERSSRYERYSARASARRTRRALRGERLPVPTLRKRKRAPAARASVAQRHSVKGCPRLPPHTSSSWPAPGDHDEVEPPDALAREPPVAALGPDEPRQPVRRANAGYPSEDLADRAGPGPRGVLGGRGRGLDDLVHGDREAGAGEGGDAVPQRGVARVLREAHDLDARDPPAEPVDERVDDRRIAQVAEARRADEGNSSGHRWMHSGPGPEGHVPRLLDGAPRR